MGMYDSVKVPCPECATPFEFQSKGGRCLLEDYTLENAPVAVLSDLYPPVATCEKCKASFKIEVSYMAWPVRCAPPEGRRDS